MKTNRMKTKAHQNTHWILSTTIIQPVTKHHYITEVYLAQHHTEIKKIAKTVCWWARTHTQWSLVQAPTPCQTQWAMQTDTAYQKLDVLFIAVLIPWIRVSQKKKIKGLHFFLTPSCPNRKPLMHQSIPSYNIPPPPGRIFWGSQSPAPGQNFSAKTFPVDRHWNSGILQKSNL